MRINHKHLKSQKGFVLVLTLMLITLMSVLAITSFELVISTTRMTNNHKKYLQALYVADAGIEHTLCVLSLIDWAGGGWTEQNGWTSEKFAGLNLGNIDNSSNSPDWQYVYNSEKNDWQWTMTNGELGSSYTITITMVIVNDDDGDEDDDPYNNKFVIESTGTVSSFTKTIVADIGNIPDPKILMWMEKEI